MTAVATERNCAAFTFELYMEILDNVDTFRGLNKIKKIKMDLNDISTKTVGIHLFWDVMNFHVYTNHSN